MEMSSQLMMRAMKSLKVSDEELAVRAEQWVAPPFKATSGTLWKYIRLVEDASNGCASPIG